MEKYTRVRAKEDIETFDDAGIAQLGNLNKIIEELNDISQQGGVVGPPGAQGQTGNPGPVGMTWRGGWSNTLNYSVRDVVYYNGSAYFCTVAINASNNNPAATPANWDLLASKGAQGSPGLPGIPGPIGPVGPAGLNWQGLWSALGTYVVDDAVGYNGASWFCINPVGPSATPPNLDTVNWSLLAAQGAQGDQGIQGLQGDPGDPGPQGPAGPPNTLTIGTVTSAASPSATITGTAPNQTLNLVLAKGDQGDPGPPGPAGTGSVVAGNAVYVSPTGNDSTGQRNNLGLPYLTINAGLAAALAGDTVVVFPGSYEMPDGLTLRDGINFQFLGTGTLTLALAVKKPLFDDTFAATTSVTCFINAPGWTFEGRGSTRTDLLIPPIERGFRKGVLKLSKASNVKFVADQIIAEDCVIYLNGSQGTAVLPSYVGAIVPILDVKANLIRKKSLANGHVCCIGGQFAQLTANVTEIIADDASNDASGPIFYEYFEKITLTADKILNNSPAGRGLCVYIDASGANDRGYFDVNFLKSGDGWCFWTAGFGTFYARIRRIECASDCCVVAYQSNLTIEGTTIVHTATLAQISNTDGIIHSENIGKITVKNCIIERLDPSIAGNDLFASETAAEMLVLNSSFDLARTRFLSSTEEGSSYANNYIKSWNGSQYVKLPVLGKSDPDALLNTDFTGSDIQGGYIYLSAYLNCAVKNSKVVNSTLYFTGNSQTIEGIVMQNDVLLSAPPIQSVNYGTTTNLTPKPVNLVVGAAGTGATTVNLPTSASFTFSFTSSLLINVSAMAPGSGAIQLGQELIAADVPPGTIIVDFGTGSGGVGTYRVSKRHTLSGFYPSSPGKAAVVKGNKFIVSDVGGGASSITVDAGVGANIAASSVSGTYTLVGGETATFTLVESSTAFLWKKE